LIYNFEFLIFLLIPLPPPSHTLFPYTTLFRSNELVTVIEVLSPTNKLPGSDGSREYAHKRERLLESHVNLVEIDLLRGGQRIDRSEEHTSELQSRGHLVCRLLLEKKKEKVWSG